MAPATARARAEATLDRLDAAGRALADLVLAVPEPHASVPATPAWTVAEVFAHVVEEVLRYEADARGAGRRAPTPERLRQDNLALVAGLPAQDLPALAGRLRSHLATLRSTILGFGEQQPTFPFDGGQSIRADIALGALLGEFLVHGHDIAAATRARWRIPPGDVPPVVEALNVVLPGWVNRDAAAGHTATYEFRVGPVRHTYEFTDGRLVVDPAAPRPASVHIAARAVPGLLALYMRRSPVRMALLAESVAWGRRPWLALTFGGLFHPP